MNINELLWSLLGMALVLVFFFDNLRARERATVLSRQACDQMGLQFLDETVALVRLGIRFGEQGLIWRRVYQFEYADDRETSFFSQYARRGKGSVILRGIALENLKIDTFQNDRNAKPPA